MRTDAARVVHELRSSEHAARARCFARGSRDGRIGGHKADRVAALVDLKRTLDLFPAERAKLARVEVPAADLGDRELVRLARFTDALELRRYQNFMHLVPRIVNVVRRPPPAAARAAALERAAPRAGLVGRGHARAGHGHHAALEPARGREPAHERVLRSAALRGGTAELLDAAGARPAVPHGAPGRHRRARRRSACHGRHRTHAPTATVGGGAGTSGTAEARLSIARAVRQLAVEAGVFLRVARFECINIVGAMNLQATLNCAAFAQAHKSSAHYDKSSFVGLAFRPAGEKCVVEIYSSGALRRRHARGRAICGRPLAPPRVQAAQTCPGRRPCAT